MIDTLKKRNSILIFIILLTMLVVLTSVFTSHYFSSKSEPVKLTVKIGIPQQLPSSLMMVAQQRGYFAAEGLDVELRRYPSGARAIAEGLLSGAVDYATAADVVFAFHSYRQTELTAIAAISLNTNSFVIIARRDRGIANLQDLKGKKIGVQANSALHYFFRAVQDAQGIERESSQLFYAPVELLGEGLQSGKYDAIVTRPPFSSEISENLGNNSIILSAPGVYLQHELLMTHKSYLHKNPEIADRMLRALFKAEQFISTHPQDAKKIVSRFMGTEVNSTDVQLPDSFEYKLTLPQTLLYLLETQAQWIRSDVLVKADEPMPDFLQHIDTAPFKRVVPSRVTVIE